jgi:hypothetical protein
VSHARRVIAWALASRVLVLLVAWLAVITLGYTLQPFQFRLSHHELWNLPARFDAGWYLGIARHGYAWNPALVGRQQNIAFFPLFPAAMRAAGEIVTVPAHLLGDPTLFGNGDTRVLWGGVLVSIAVFTLAMLCLFRLTAARLDEDRAMRTVLLAASYPFAVYFSAPYAEATFLGCALASLWALSRRRLGLAALFGCLAGLARPNGWAVAFALPAALEAPDAHAPVPASRAAWFVCAAPFVGTALYSCHVWRLTGWPFTWAAVQAGWGRPVPPGGFFASRWAALAADGPFRYLVAQPADALTIVAVAGTLALVPIIARRLSVWYALFVAVYLLPALIIDIPSLGRMTSAAFPIFPALAAVLPRRATIAVVILFALLQAWVAASFFRWLPPY